MGSIINFFKWIAELLSTALEWVAEVPGKITLFVTTFITTVVTAVGVLSTNISEVVSFLSSASSKVGVVSSSISAHQTGGFLVHVLSLDVCFSYIVSVAGVFCAIVGGIFITLFAYALTAYVIPLALKVVFKVLSVLSGGFVKV